MIVTVNCPSCGCDHTITDNIGVENTPENIKKYNVNVGQISSISELILVCQPCIKKYNHV